MMLRAAAAFALTLASPVAAQQAVSGPGGDIRILDKQTGIVTDVTLESGSAVRLGLISVGMRDCRYPADNPSGDGFAYLTIHYSDVEDPVFDGWMIASSPALNALDHPRYDVWVLRCNSA